MVNRRQIDDLGSPPRIDEQDSVILNANEWELAVKDSLELRLMPPKPVSNYCANLAPGRSRKVEQELNIQFE